MKVQNKDADEDTDAATTKLDLDVHQTKQKSKLSDATKDR